MNLLMLLGHEPPVCRPAAKSAAIKKTSERHPQLDPIRRLLSDGRWHSTSEIHEHLGGRVLKTNVAHALARLREQGEVLQSRYGHAESHWKKPLTR